MENGNLSEKKSNTKNILIKTAVIALIIAAFVLFVGIFEYSYLNDGSEIFQTLINGG